MSFIRFESARKKEEARKELREAREELLEKAKQNAEKRAERKVQELLKGETNWMLPSVASKFESDNIKKKSKKSKKKTSKKSKRKKRKRRHSSSSSSSEETDSESDSSSSSEELRLKKSKKTKKSKKKRKRDSSSKIDEVSSKNDKLQDEEWVEKSSIQLKQKLERDNWMMSSAAFSLKTFSKERNEPEKRECDQVEKYDPTKSVLELNPYWKTTGTGLPGFQKPKDQSDDEEKPWQQVFPSSGNRGNWRKNTASVVRETCNKDQNQKHTVTTSESSLSSDSENEQTFSASEFLTDQQMNELGAKLVKAEILGNMDLANKLKAKLEAARTQRASIKDIKKQNTQKSSIKTVSGSKDDHILLTHTDKLGNSRPLQAKKDVYDTRDLYGGGKGRKKSGKRIETHVDFERVRYFPDDDKYDIKQMFEREKYSTAAESNLQFADIACKHKNPNDDLEDVFADKVSKNISKLDSDKKELQRAIKEHEKLSTKLENCDKCFESDKMNKSLIVSMGEKVFLSLPWHIGLQNGHCMIVPTQHAICCTQLDEDTWEEIENHRKALTRMFAAQKKDVIFFEIANKLHRKTHLSIHCIPVSMSQGEMAPFYFKKAIEESEHEWSVNKQLVKLTREKGLRSCIPKGLPYIWVHFGIDNGFAHVIEDENRFPNNFALEIIGGMLNLDPSKWRRPQKEQNFVSKVKLFADYWKKFDCTQ